jgi:hypothetical protein
MRVLSSGIWGQRNMFLQNVSWLSCGTVQYFISEDRTHYNPTLWEFQNFWFIVSSIFWDRTRYKPKLWVWFAVSSENFKSLRISNLRTILYYKLLHYKPKLWEFQNSWEFQILWYPFPPCVEVQSTAVYVCQLYITRILMGTFRSLVVRTNLRFRQTSCGLEFLVYYQPLGHCHLQCHLSTQGCLSC